MAMMSSKLLPIWKDFYPKYVHTKFHHHLTWNNNVRREGGGGGRVHLDKSPVQIRLTFACFLTCFFRCVSRWLIVEHFQEMPVCTSQNLGNSTILWRPYMLFEIHREASQFINSTWYTESLYQQFMFWLFRWSWKIYVLRAVRESTP